MVALRALVLDPGRVSQFGKRLLSRAHRAASSTCKNLFLKTPPTQVLGKKSSGKPSAQSAPPHAPRGVRRAFSTLRRGERSLKARQEKETKHDRHK
jgi:hypothetical protein